MKNKLIKTISVILLCFILMTQFYACKPDDTVNDNPKKPDNPTNVVGESETVEVFYTSKEIADAIMAVYAPEDIPEAGLRYRYSGAEENSENYIEPEEIGILTTGIPNPVEEMDLVEDFAFYTPGGYNVFEVDVLKVKDNEKNNIDAVKTVLDNRLSRKVKARGDVYNYIPEDVPLLDNAKVITAGNYIILLATTDNSKAEKVITDMIRSGNNSSLSNQSNQPAENNTTTEIQNETEKVVNMGEVMNIEPEILFDFDILSGIELAVQNQTETGMRKTPVPKVSVKKHSHDTSFIIGGKCEIGAMIRVTGGTEEIYTGSDNGDYLVEIPFAKDGITILKLTAESPGKAPSDETAFVVKARKDVDMYERYGTFGVIVGYNYMSYFDDCLPDYIGDNLINDAAITSLKDRISKRISDLRAKNCNAEIIYLLVPNTVRTWAEDMPRRYIKETSDTLLRQWKKGVTDGGATVLDLSDVMMKHKNDEYKIWHKTDSHWTEYGAYIGYVELMNYISQKFPDAAPRPRSDFEFYNQETNIGDIWMRLEIENADLKETTSFAKFNFDPPHFNPNFNKGHLGLDLYERNNIYIIHDRVAFEHTTKSNVPGNLPTVYVMRDSFEGCLHAFYTDRFSTATFQSMWSYGHFDTNAIAKLNPDYILYVISERNLKNVLYN
jgi:hypothetical protein